MMMCNIRRIKRDMEERGRSLIALLDQYCVVKSYVSSVYRTNQALSADIIPEG